MTECPCIPHEVPELQEDFPGAVVLEVDPDCPIHGEAALEALRQTQAAAGTLARKRRSRGRSHMIKSERQQAARDKQDERIARKQQRRVRKKKNLDPELRFLLSFSPQRGIT
jgi:hypothetical protein